jgi:aspartate-semialdehyde dehydrogenase
MSQPRIPVGILGATGMVGQSFINFLQGHPWFEITFLGASDRSAGKPYHEATQWRLEGEMPASVATMKVEECKPTPGAPKLVFSATDSSVATEIERAFAEAGHLVVSNSRNYRMEHDVPLLVPEVNPDHLKLLPLQSKRGWKGSIATNPNCVAIPLALALAPFKPFGIMRVLANSMQAVSGAGYPGVPSMDILGNVIPYIGGGEEDKVEKETIKILGDLKVDHVENLPARVSAQCNRVASVDGHLVAASLELAQKPTREELLHAIRSYAGVPQLRKLPSAPAQAIYYMDQQDRPQPRRDAGRDRGMAVSMGRLRECPVLDWKFVCMAHNTIRGAAGAAVLNAELMHSEGLLQ